MADLIDIGTAPEYFASGLHCVEVLGPVSRFVMFVTKKLPDGTEYREVPFTYIIPNDAIGPAIILTLQTLPSGVIVPAAAQIARGLILN